MIGKKCGPHNIAWILVIVGALNWGLVGALNFNLVNWAVGSWPTVERIVYVLVGLSALMMFMMKACKGCKMCKDGCKECEGKK